MSRYDSDNYIPERNYMARFDPGDGDGTEMVPMRPPAPQGYQGYSGPSRGYPTEDDRGSQGDSYARNVDPRYPPGPRYDPEPRPYPSYPPQVQNNYRSDSPRSYNGRPFTPERGGPYGGYPVEPELVAYNSQRYESRPDMHPDNDPDRYERVRGERYDGYEYDRNYGRDRPESFSAHSGPTHYTHEFYYEDEHGPSPNNIQFSQLHIIVLIYVILFLYSCSQVLMGGLFLYRCPVDDFVPEWNLVVGIVTIGVVGLIGVVHFLELCRRRYKVPVITDSGERAKTAQSLTHLHKMSFIVLTIIQLIAWVAGTCVIADKRPEFDLERNDDYNDLYDYNTFELRRGQSRFYDAEIMNPDYCDPGIWVYTLVGIIVGWVYLLIVMSVWIYLFCYLDFHKGEVAVKEIKPTEQVYLEQQKSQPNNYV